MALFDFDKSKLLNSFTNLFDWWGQEDLWVQQNTELQQPERDNSDLPTFDEIEFNTWDIQIFKELLDEGESPEDARQAILEVKAEEMWIQIPMEFNPDWEDIDNLIEEIWDPSVLSQLQDVGKNVLIWAGWTAALIGAQTKLWWTPDVRTIKQLTEWDTSQARQFRKLQQSIVNFSQQELQSQDFGTQQAVNAFNEIAQDVKQSWERVTFRTLANKLENKVWQAIQELDTTITEVSNKVWPLKNNQAISLLADIKDNLENVWTLSSKKQWLLNDINKLIQQHNKTWLTIKDYNDIKRLIGTWTKWWTPTWKEWAWLNPENAREIYSDIRQFIEDNAWEDWAKIKEINARIAWNAKLSEKIFKQSFRIDNIPDETLWRIRWFATDVQSAINPFRDVKLPFLDEKQLNELERKLTKDLKEVANIAPQAIAEEKWAKTFRNFVQDIGKKVNSVKEIKAEDFKKTTKAIFKEAPKKAQKLTKAVIPAIIPSILEFIPWTIGESFKEYNNTSPTVVGADALIQSLQRSSMTDEEINKKQQELNQLNNQIQRDISNEINSLIEQWEVSNDDIESLNKSLDQAWAGFRVW